MNPKAIWMNGISDSRGQAVRSDGAIYWQFGYQWRSEKVSDTGVVFPVDDSGKRSSLSVNQAIWADAAAAADPTLERDIRSSKKWRNDYADYIPRVTAHSADSRETAEQISSAGLDSVRNHLVFERDGVTTPLNSIADVTPSFEFDTETIVGEQEPTTEIVVPFRGEKLRGDALRRQLADWVSRGIIEPSALSAINLVMENPDWLQLEGKRIGLLGAGAQTSPMQPLTSWGVDVLAVDLADSQIAQRLSRIASNGASTVHLPIRPKTSGSDAPLPGANLIEDVPELTAWLGGFGDEPLVLGFFIYADGPLHVQATVAADLIGTSLADAGQDVAMAYAGTPSDCYLVPEDVVEDSNGRRRSRPGRAMELGMRALTRGKLYAPAYGEMLVSSDGEPMGIIDAIVTQQGPNYSLAKRLQRWRVIDSWRQGRMASFNVAPPTWTTSVTKNKLLAAGYYGATRGGLEVFAPSTMCVLMAALLVHDLHVKPQDEHPEIGITRDGVHGGYWRVPHDIRTTLAYTGIVGLPQAYMPEINFR